jgi:hypothetical protein
MRSYISAWGCANAAPGNRSAPIAKAAAADLKTFSFIILFLSGRTPDRTPAVLCLIIC